MSTLERTRESPSGMFSRGTMPPPELSDREAPASVGALVLRHLRVENPTPRRTGSRADEAHLHARIAEARIAEDTAAERSASIGLARLLSARGRDLRMATDLARRALSLGEDRELRSELAGWLAGLGDTEAAAETLRPALSSKTANGEDSETARTLVKIAVLMARAGQAPLAAEALDEAAALDPSDAVAIELFATLSSWSPDTVTSEGAALGYLEAASRRAAAGDREAAFEDCLRAFDVAPQHPEAAAALASALKTRGLVGAADEVMRSHGIAVGEVSQEGSRAVHRTRMLVALAEGDAPRAVAALLDAGLDGVLDGDDTQGVDETLALGGLNELLAVRLEMRAERQEGASRSAICQALAKLYAGPLASPDRSIEAWIEALASDPNNAVARAALRDHASQIHDPGPLAEALVRIGTTGDAAARETALRELVVLADEKMGEPALAAWALDALTKAGSSVDLAHAEKLGLWTRVKRQDEELTAARRALEGADSGEARLKALRRVAAAYQGRPGSTGELIAVLAELSQRLPSERSFLVALERVTHRAPGNGALAGVFRERIASGAARVDIVRARLGLCAMARRAGGMVADGAPSPAEARALNEVLPLLAEAPGHRGAACTALVLATRTGSLRERADALVQLGGPTWPALRATLLSVAAELYLAAGEADLGRRTAEQACEADPSCARAVTTLSAASFGRLDRLATSAIERAVTTVVPRGLLCEQLARVLDAVNEAPLALAWTQRWLALRPGSAEAMHQFLRRSSAARDAVRITDAVSWVLAQPRPIAEFAEPILDALIVLLDVDRPRARALARRALDVIGPKVPAICAGLLDLSDRCTDPGLAIAVLERSLAASPEEPAAGGRLLELARRRTDAGDYDGAAREIARASEAGPFASAVLGQVKDLENAVREAGMLLGSEGLLAIAEARARALEVDGPDSVVAAGAAWREVGSLRWDLAFDPRGAEEAFFRACELTPATGAERYARDLCAFGGVLSAIDLLMARAACATDDSARKLRAQLLIEAATLANVEGLGSRALAAALNAIECDPSRADAVALVEKNSDVVGGLDAVDRTYDILAGAALGRFGRRAAHSRGARKLECRGALDLALRHAAACLEAVPSEGASYVRLARLAERTGDPSEAVRALERVADGALPADRSVWLKRAASLAGSTEEGLRTRLDLLLRALNARPDSSTVRDVVEAVRALVSASADADAAAELTRLRLGHAVRALLPKLDGPEGARTAISVARLALDLPSTELAFLALGRAADVDGDIDEYTTLMSSVEHLGSDAERARGWVDAVRAAADKPYSSAGRSLLQLVAELASVLGDATARAELLVLAVRRDPDHDPLVAEADIAVAWLGDQALAAKFDEAMPPSLRLDALLRDAEQRERDRDPEGAVAALERAFTSGLLPPEGQDRVASRLLRLLRDVGRDGDAEQLLRLELSRQDLSPQARDHAAQDLAELLLRRDDRAGAIDVLAALSLVRPHDANLLGAIRGLSRSTGDLTRYAEVLTAALGSATSDSARLLILRELAPLRHEISGPDAADELYREIIHLDPADVQALEILERDADERGDHEAISFLLGRRISLLPAGERKRMLRLRRAAVLEQRLGRLTDAVRELEMLLSETPDDSSALRFVADLYERLGSPLAAAAVQRRLGELAETSDEQVAYGLRAAAAYVAGGEVDIAETIVESVAPRAARESVLDLRIEILRKRGDGAGLADALDELSAWSPDGAERCAAILVEAARASSKSGDDGAALDRARRAVKLAPHMADAVLEARRLEYRAGGAGTPREAQAAVEDLARIESHMEPAHLELHAFLLAEELDVIQGGGAGMRELSRRHAEVGPLPLIALGMAERLVRGKNFDPALPLFELALAGDLRGLRSRGRVALAAAEAAVAAQAYDVAVQLLDLAAGEGDTGSLAGRKKLELAASVGAPEVAQGALEELLLQSAGLDRARVLFQLASLVGAADPDAAQRHFAEAAQLCTVDRGLLAQVLDATARLQAVREAFAPSEPSSSVPAPEVAVPRLARSAGPPPLPTTPPVAAEAAHQPEVPAALDEPSLGEPPNVPESNANRSRPPPLPIEGALLAPGALPSQPPPDVVAESEENLLLQEVRGGSFEAGERLVAILGREPGRSRDVLAVRRAQAQLKLGDHVAMRRLIEAAVLDGSAAYARALEHVVQVATPGATPSLPPPLAAQRHSPELVASLLFRSVAESVVHEALGLVLDTGLYRREVADYHLTGVARVQPGGGSVLGETYGIISRYLGQTRTGLFHQRQASVPNGTSPPPALGPTVKIALLATPAIVFSGEVREETPELNYMLGEALAAAMPENALVSGLGEAGLRTLLDALIAAFGPVTEAPASDPDVARLAQNLWQLVHPRADRRLRELCADPSQITYEAAIAGTRQAMRRAGLFASGRLATALAAVAPDLPLPLDMYLLAPDGLVQASIAHAGVADLVRLAISTEFAEARWLPGASADRRRADQGSRFPRRDPK